MTILVLNSHSLPLANKLTEDELIETFLRILVKCKNYGANVLLIDSNYFGEIEKFYTISLNHSLSLAQWIQQKEKQSAYKDLCRIAKLMLAKPLFSQAVLDEINQNIEVDLFSYSKSETALAAYWHKAYLISFLTKTLWKEALLEINITQLNANGSVETIEENLKNLATLEHFYHYENDIRNTFTQSLNNAKDIWEKREHYFPNLCFLENQVGSQLRNWTARNDVLEKAKECLFVLNEFSKKWQNKEFADYQHHHLKTLGLPSGVSGESQKVKNTPKLREKREFFTEDGDKIFCENHIKLSSGFRLHFYPDPKTHQIYIAYLGTHLPLS